MNVRRNLLSNSPSLFHTSARAKTILLQKIENENNLLKHHNLKTYDEDSKLPSFTEIKNINAEKITQKIRLRLNNVEKRFSKKFYSRIFPLFPTWLSVKRRVHRNATKSLNNLLNLSYEILKCKVLKATLKEKLEPYLDFLHSIQYGKPSLVCDLVEPFRPYVIHFLIQCSQTLKQKHFKRVYIKNRYPRYFLTHETTWKLIENINKHLFEAYIPLQRNRKHGSHMQFETLIDEYAGITAKYINTSTTETPRPIFPTFTTFS